MVGEPTVEDTISILRGLRERYETHHHVRIKDSALVAAAVLSNRYITDRFLPDKAIDLVDEAASRIRMEMDSRPVELDEVERRANQLKIEREALRKETDAGSRKRLADIEKEIADLDAEALRLRSLWEAEKRSVGEASGIKEQIEQSERHEKEHTFQLGDAPRLPANTREEAAVARWIEVDKRRYKARVLGLPFSYTQAERQLKRRLLKAGLIIVKPLTFRLSPRDKRKIDQAGRLRAAKASAARGDAGAIQALQEIEHDRKVDAWTKKMRSIW